GHVVGVGVAGVGPVVVAALAAARGRRRLRRVALEPVLHDVVVELLRPEQARVGLTDDGLLALAERPGNVARVERIRLADAVREDAARVGAAGLRVGGEAQLERHRAARRDLEPVVAGRLRAPPPWTAGPG